jgi:hypothetical protein
MMPLPGGITSTFLNAFLVQLMKWKRSSLRRSSMARFFSNACGSKPPALHRQRVVDDQLRRHHRVDLRRVAALLGDGVTQAGEVHQRGLAEDVVAHHAGREPREVEVALALDQLLQGIGERGRVAAAHQVFRQHAGGVRQGVVGAGLNRLDRRTDVEVIQGCRAGFAEFCVHRVRTRSRWFQG